MVHIIKRVSASMFEHRELRATDRQAVFQLLEDIDLRYPSGQHWLDQRYDDIILRKALGMGVFANGRLAGLTILSPKGERRSKLSTIKVASGWRRHGVGTALLDFVQEFWRWSAVVEAWVTVNSDDPQTTAFLIDHGGFDLHDCVGQRYLESSSENILKWTPDAGSRRTSIVH